MSRENKYNKDLDHDTDIMQSAKQHLCLIKFNDTNISLRFFLFYLNYNQKYLQKLVCNAYISFSFFHSRESTLTQCYKYIERTVSKKPVLIYLFFFPIEPNYSLLRYFKHYFKKRERVFKHLRIVKENSKDCARSDAYLISDHLFGFLNSFCFFFDFYWEK